MSYQAFREHSGDPSPPPDALLCSVDSDFSSTDGAALGHRVPAQASSTGPDHSPQHDPRSVAIDGAAEREHGENYGRRIASRNHHATGAKLDGPDNERRPPAAYGHHSHGDDQEHPHHRDYGQTPIIVTWEVTQACELSCDHCRADANPDRDPDELTTAEGKRLLDQIAQFGSPQPILVFSGGDPLERPDLFELLEYAATVGLRTAVTPAPTSALTESVLDRFVDVGVRRIALSLDGATAASHDTFRGEEGSFETIRQSAEYARKIGLSIQINTTVTAATVDQLPDIADLVEEFGAAMWEVFFLVPIGRGATLEQLSPAKAEETLAWLYRRQRTAQYRVITVEAPHYRRIATRIEQDEGRGDPRVGSTGDGNGFIFVSHTGAVYPSGFLPIELGNIRTDNLVKLYQNASLLQQLRDPDQFRGACRRCPHRSRCGGSRARAYAITGDPLASDPLCAYVPADQ